MSVLHDIRCRSCTFTERNIEIHAGIFPRCPICGRETTWIPFIAKTDVYGHPVYSEAAGRWVGSSRERDKIMKAAGFEPCGDRVGGARNHSHLGLGKSTSYPGQVRRPAPLETRKGNERTD